MRRRESSEPNEDAAANQSEHEDAMPNDMPTIQLFDDNNHKLTERIEVDPSNSPLLQVAKLVLDRHFAQTAHSAIYTSGDSVEYLIYRIGWDSGRFSVELVKI